MKVQRHLIRFVAVGDGSFTQCGRIVPAARSGFTSLPPQLAFFSFQSAITNPLLPRPRLFPAPRPALAKLSRLNAPWASVLARTPQLNSSGPSVPTRTSRMNPTWPSVRARTLKLNLTRPSVHARTPWLNPTRPSVHARTPQLNLTRPSVQAPAGPCGGDGPFLAVTKQNLKIMERTQ